jgi:hypothetical protein
MKRLLCGSVVLAASLGLVSCNSDPTSDFRNGPSAILADPSTMFIDQGGFEEVVVTLVDDQGDPLAGDFEVSAAGTGITVERNPDFLGTTVGAPLESQAQFIVTAGDAPVPSSFTLTSGELSLEIPVNVLPTSVVPAAFSNPTPAANEPVTVTAEGYTFLPDAQVIIGGDSAVILGRAEDGSSVTFVPAPSTTGPVLLEKIAIDFLPTTPLTIPTVAELTVAPVVPKTGTDAPGTAPALTVAPVGESSVLYDGGTFDYLAPTQFGDVPARLYSFTVPADGNFTVTLDWALGVEDMGVYYFLPDGTTETGSFADEGAAGIHPEESTSSFTAGTYLMAVVNWSAPTVDFPEGTNPPFFSIQFTTEPPPPEE